MSFVVGPRPAEPECCDGSCLAFWKTLLECVLCRRCVSDDELVARACEDMPRLRRMSSRSPSPSTPRRNGRCARCRLPASGVCGFCRQTLYCSTACMNQDLAAHAARCRENYAQMLAERQPSEPASPRSPEISWDLGIL